MPTTLRTWLGALCLAATLLWSGAARAQTSTSWTFVPGAVLSPQPSIPFASLSVGSPSVAYDSIRNQFLMVFEAKQSTTDPNCPQGLFGLGLATSPNGINWTVDSRPLLLPTGTDGTYWECVAAHPSAVFVDNGANGSLQVYFKAEQGIDGCPTDPASCQYSGIGRLRVNFNSAGTPTGIAVQNTPALPFAAGDVGGFPKIIKDGNDFILTMQRYPDIHLVTSTDFRNFGATTPVVSVADYAPFVSWVEDEFFNPATVCDDSVAFPFGMFVGGRDTRFATIVSGAMSKAIASIPSLWALSTTPQVEWATNDAWRHWDVQRLITGDYLVWFSEKDASGNNFIRFGGTTLTFNMADVQGKICP